MWEAKGRKIKDSIRTDNDNKNVFHLRNSRNHRLVLDRDNVNYQQ